MYSYLLMHFVHSLAYIVYSFCLMFIPYEYCELAIMHLCCGFEVLHCIVSIFSCSYFSIILSTFVLSRSFFISTI